MTKFGPNITAKQKCIQSTLLISCAIVTALLISSIVILSDPQYKRALEKTLKSDYIADSLSLSSIFFSHRSDENELSTNELSPGKESVDSFSRVNMSLVDHYETLLSHQHATSLTTSSSFSSDDSKKTNLTATIDTSGEARAKSSSPSTSSFLASTLPPQMFTSMTTSYPTVTIVSVSENDTNVASNVTSAVEKDQKNGENVNIGHSRSLNRVSTSVDESHVTVPTHTDTRESVSHLPSSSPSSSTSLSSSSSEAATASASSSSVRGREISSASAVKPSSDAHEKDAVKPHKRPMTSSSTADETTRGSERVNETSDMINDFHGTYDPNTLKSEIITAIDSEHLAPFVKLVGSHVTVDCKLGKIRGIQADVQGKLVNAFLGIPYAEAPVGDLRFKKTVKLSRPWMGTLDATKFKPHCPQHFDLELVKKRSPTTNLMTEDCLHLNIWAPAESTDRKLKPVMVWVFGGGFSGGSGNLDEFDGRILTALGDVVVVNFNYRVGSLGFLDLNVADAPGNQGLYDIKECLLWIKENIQYFGGDANEITLVGQSAGAISIGLLMVNDHSSKLFSRAILQSGSPVMLNFFFSRNEETADKFIRFMNCSESGRVKNTSPESSVNESIDSNENTPEEVIENDFEQRRQNELKCLKSKSIGQVIEAQKFILDSSAFPFTPEPNEQFLPFMATESLRADIGSKMYKETFNHVNDVLIGTNADEASVILHMEVPEIFALDEIKLNITSMSQLRELVTTNLSKEFSIEPSAAAIFSSLFLNRGPEIDTTQNLIKRLYQVLGDLAFICPVNSLVEGLTERGKNVYQYVFDYRSSASPWGTWMGVTHGDEYIFTFGHPIRYPSRYSRQDIEMSRRMVHTWTHFAKYG